MLVLYYSTSIKEHTDVMMSVNTTYQFDTLFCTVIIQLTYY